MPPTFNGLTIAASAFRDTAVHGHPGLLQALQVFFRRLRPAGLLGLTLGLVAEVEANLVGLVQLALKIDVSLGLGQLFLLYGVLSIGII